MAEEEVIEEVEAVQAVYGDDCRVLVTYPPHLRVHLKPRTAEVSSQQFVEAIIGMQAGLKYPEVPPDITVIDSKGLDEQRQKHLINSIQERASELASCLMFVALCEEAVERLSSMNHPDGDCPLCLYPLLDEGADNSSRPFMKLMSCFHCFHCDCIIRWWNWTKVEGGKEYTSSSSSSSTFCRTAQDHQDMRKMMEESMGRCPVCRKVFHEKDIEHVLGLVGTVTPLDSSGIEVDKIVLESDSEKVRRQKIEAIIKLQQENNGLIELKKDEVLQPGMFLPQAVATLSSIQSENEDIPAPKPDSNPGSSGRRPGSRRHSNSHTRRHRPQNPRKQPAVHQWIRKDHASEN